MNNCLRGFVAKLLESYRKILLLGEFKGPRYEQVAHILGLSLGTVKIRLQGARQQLREELAGNCGPEWVEGNEFLPHLRRKKKSGVEKEEGDNSSNGLEERCTPRAILSLFCHPILNSRLCGVSLLSRNLYAMSDSERGKRPYNNYSNDPVSGSASTDSAARLALGKQP